MKRLCRNLGFILIFILFISGIFACSRQPVYETPVRNGPDLVVDLSGLQENVPRFFTYPYSGKKLNFFVVKIGGTAMSFLDACNTCYPYKRGYEFENGLLVCRYCRERYRVDQIATGAGNCYPVRLSGRVQNGRYLISVSAVERNASRF